jgi:hypothetical protein
MLPLELLLRMRGGIHPFIPWRVCSTIGSLKNNYYKMSTYSVPVRVLWDKPLAVKKKPIELNPRLPNDPCGRLWLEVAV